MDFKSESARAYFLKYALPCSDTLVARGKISREKVKEMIMNVSSGRKTPEGSERMFETAVSMCERIARNLGKNLIDKETVRRYFFFEHDRVVNKRYNSFKDFDTLKCRVYSGIVLKLDSRASVETIIGKRRYRTDFVRDLEIKDCVTVHRDFIVERISKNMFETLWKMKENYFKRDSIIT